MKKSDEVVLAKEQTPTPYRNGRNVSVSGLCAYPFLLNNEREKGRILLTYIENTTKEKPSVRIKRPKAYNPDAYSTLTPDLANYDTKRKQLQESENSHQSLFESMDQGFCVLFILI